KRWDILEALVTHAADAGDHNLPLMYWYAAEPLAEEDPGRALDFAVSAKVPLLLPFMARRVASTAKPAALAQGVRVPAEAADTARQLTMLRGINEGLKGRPRVEMPKEWTDAYAKLSRNKDGDVRSQALVLGVTFGDPTAISQMRGILANAKANLAARLDALA